MHKINLILGSLIYLAIPHKSQVHGLQNSYNTDALSSSLESKMVTISHMSIPELRTFLKNNRGKLPVTQRQIVKKRIKELKRMKKQHSFQNNSKHSSESPPRVNCPPIESPTNGLVIGNKYRVVLQKCR